MRRLVTAVVVVGVLGACNQVFGIPDISQSNNSCAQRLVQCAPEATCTDTASGSTCTCNQGYTGDGLTCMDVDECAAATSPCAAHASCANSVGSFSCTCENGFTGDGTSYCVPATFKKLAPSGLFSCGLGGDGGIYCWGNNSVGSLGDGTVVSHARPQQVGTSTDWIDVDAHSLEACGIRADHSMWCWGFGTEGQLGDGRTMTEYTPTGVISDKPGVRWKALALGNQAACGIHDDGSLACWGSDRVADTPIALPVAVGTDTDWTDIAVSTVQCGLRGSPGHLYCWGKSADGVLGLGSVTSQATPAQVGADTWKSVKVGFSNACGIRSDGALLCWGNNPRTTTALKYGNTPQQVGAATDWQAIGLYTDWIVGLRTGGSAYVWGINNAGQIGLSPGSEIVQPTPLGGTVTGWSEIRPGSNHGCGIVNGRGYCWGIIGDGNLGNGVSTTLYGPTKIGSDRWTQLAGGAGQCGLRSDGALLCWGSNSTTVGIGFGNTDPVPAPTRLGTDTWTAVAGGLTVNGAASCAIRGGAPYCWGDNKNGQLGIGNTATPQLSPAAVNVPNGTQWTEIAISGDHTCAIKSDATLWCWGLNAAGQLGTGTTSNTPTTAPPVAPLAGAWLHVAVTFEMTCGIKTDHTLWCWGQDQFPAATLHQVPTQVGTEATWASLSMDQTANLALFSGPTTCGIKLDGSLWCWGLWLGDGTQNPSPTPVQVGTATDWKTIAVGAEICATKTGGTLWCWGNGNDNLLGDGKPPTAYDMIGSLAPTTTPTQIGSDTDWSVAMTSGSRGNESCALKTDGSLWCWGAGAAPISPFVTTPVPIN